MDLKVQQTREDERNGRRPRSAHDLDGWKGWNRREKRFAGDERRRCSERSRRQKRSVLSRHSERERVHNVRRGRWGVVVEKER